MFIKEEVAVVEIKVTEKERSMEPKCNDNVRQSRFKNPARCPPLWFTEMGVEGLAVLLLSLCIKPLK